MSNYSSNDRQGETGPNRLIDITIFPDGWFSLTMLSILDTVMEITNSWSNLKLEF